VSSRRKAKSVTDVSGAVCHLCLGPLTYYWSFFRTEQRGRRASGVRGFSRQALCARTTIAIARQNLMGI
jgi:hypothetical protein